MTSQKIVVLHSLFNWLPITENWIYNQILYLPSDIKNHVLVYRELENLDVFPFANIHCLIEKTTWHKIHNYAKKLSQFTFPPIRLVSRGLYKLNQHQAMHFFIKTARRYNAHVLHSHFGNIGWINIPLAKQAKLKHVVTFYGHDVNRLPLNDNRWYERYKTLFRHVDCILCEGPYMAQSVVKLGCPPNKVKVHHLGVEIDKISFKPRTWKKNTPLRVLLAASFREKKGLPYGLEALGKLQNDIPIEITMIGDATHEQRSQMEKQKIMTILDKYHLTDKTRMLGFQSHDRLLEEAYKHHIFLSPSVTAKDGDTEGGAPVAIIEMIATGMPIVSTTHCDIPEVVNYGDVNLLAAERDVTGLVQKLKWLIDHAEKWETITKVGRKHVEQEFDAAIQAQKLSDIYFSLHTN